VSRGRPEFDRERCKGCALCIGACPEKILALSRNQFNRQGVPFAVCFDEPRCTACLSCAIICPDMAIRIFRPAPALQNPRDTVAQE
jgi:2-oxoglutarate ferredoxin oxidoreductase subunit delta